MAAANAVQSLTEEVTCSICLGFYQDPVTLECEHNFCRSCITKYWEGAQGHCPQCREICPTGNLKPNRQLQSIVEIAKELSQQTARPQEQNVCQKHEEKLKLFCQEHQTPICLVCSLSAEHKAHTVVPIEEAALQYKDKFQSYLGNMKRKLQNILGLQCKEETTVTYLEEKFKSQKERITSVFNKVHQLLEKEKRRRLSNLEEKEKRTLKEIRAKVTELDKQQVSFKSQITELETRCQQPDVELLKDVKSLLSRYDNMYSHPADPEPSNDHEKKTEKDEECDEVEKEDDLESKILESLEWSWARHYAGEVTLDPDTANPWLVLSENGRSVRDGDRAKSLPDTPERFNPAINVLGRERLSSGRLYWEVKVGHKTGWTLGVCDESVCRKGRIMLSPQDGYWAVWLRDGEYEALTFPRIPLIPRVPPRVVGLFLDYEAGRLSVYNVTDRSLLFIFSGASFPDTLRPYFSPWLLDGGKNVGALRILPVTG